MKILKEGIEIMTEECCFWIDDHIDGKCEITEKICGFTCHLTEEQEKELIKEGFQCFYVYGRKSEDDA